MARKRKRDRMEAAGWLFFIITFFVVLGPVIYVLYQFQSPLANQGAVYGLGLFVAMFVAGVITWLANSALQWRAARYRAASKSKAGGH